METNIEAILQKLKRSGLRFTGKRKATVEWFVCNQDRYLSAKEVHEHLKTLYPRISFDTVYRTLSTLLEHHIIEHMEFSNDAAKYRLQCQESHHHHLVCVGCGSTFPIEACPMDGFSADLHRIKVLTHRFEVYGYCEQCFSAS